MQTDNPELNDNTTPEDEDEGEDVAGEGQIDSPTVPVSFWYHILYKTREGWCVLTDGMDNILSIHEDEIADRLASMKASGQYLDVRSVQGEINYIEDEEEVSA